MIIDELQKIIGDKSFDKMQYYVFKEKMLREKNIVAPPITKLIREGLVKKVIEEQASIFNGNSIIDEMIIKAFKNKDLPCISIEELEDNQFKVVQEVQMYRIK